MCQPTSASDGQLSSQNESNPKDGKGAQFSLNTILYSLNSPGSGAHLLDYYENLLLVSWLSWNVSLSQSLD